MYLMSISANSLSVSVLRFLSLSCFLVPVQPVRTVQLTDSWVCSAVSSETAGSSAGTSTASTSWTVSARFGSDAGDDEVDVDVCHLTVCVSDVFR